MTLAVGALTVLSSCGLLNDQPIDGFSSYTLCPNDSPGDCVSLYGVDDLAKVNVSVEETPEEVRILVDATRTDDDTPRSSVDVYLAEPLGDRAVIDAISGSPVPHDD